MQIVYMGYTSNQIDNYRLTAFYVSVNSGNDTVRLTSAMMP